MSSTTTHQLYAGSYATAEQPGIYTYVFNETNGTLTPGGSFTGVTSPSFVLRHPNGQWFYAVSETRQKTDGVAGSVWALRYLAESDSFEVINHQISGGDWPCHLAIDATGRWLLVSNYGSGSVGVLPIQQNGALGDLSCLVQHQGSGPNSARQEGPHAHSATFSPDQRFVIITDLGVDALITYIFDAHTGQLHTPHRTATRPGAGPRHLAFHPNGDYVYVANELDNTVAAYTYDPAAGILTEQQVIATLPEHAPENTVADIHISSAGDRLYVSNRGHDSIATFALKTQGELELLSIQSCGGRCPRNFAISPNDQFLLVANQESHELVVLPILNAPEALGATVSQVPLKGASCVQFLAIR